MKKYNVIDLFCGAGGLSRGFLDDNNRILIGLDMDKAALNTFEKNHNGAIGLNMDLSQKGALAEIRKLTNGEDIDIIVAGPPCQGFSLSGSRDFEDERNKLYLAVLEAVKLYQPKAFIIENVPGMATLYKGKVKDEIISRLSSYGYNVDCKVLCAADYGVPQIRKRLIFMGIKKEYGYPRFPEPLYNPSNYVTCKDALSDLPSLEIDLGEEIMDYATAPQTEYQKLMRAKSDKVYNHIGTKHTELVKSTIALVPEGGNYKDLPEGWGQSRRFNEAWTRYSSSKPSKTIDTGHRNHFHYKYNRVPTVRENARLQSFSDDFIFTGNKTEQYRQVGNAVPPILGKVLSETIKAILAEHSQKQLKTIELFAGCGGLVEGFEESTYYKTVAAIEWEKGPVANLRNRLKQKWKYENADEITLRFDIQRTDELLNGWENDEEYGTSKGLNYLVEEAKGIDLIIGGPPCQAYSLAGRIGVNKEKEDDYRKFLFEKYLAIVDKYRPKLIVFENVPGMLTAKANDELIVESIQKAFSEQGYVILNDLRKAIIDCAEFGVPQHRKRVIIIGLDKQYFGDNAEQYLQIFYDEILPKYKSDRIFTVKDAIGDLPKLLPTDEAIKVNSAKTRHSLPTIDIKNHIVRWHNDRDMKIFKILAQDIEDGINKYESIESLKQLYTELTGKTSNIHKYHVLRWDKPSNVIPAHLHKDGLRHIHPDSEQARSITIREAARLQTFSDDYEFIGSNVEAYKMIGNAVPPKFALCLAKAIKEFLLEYLNVHENRV